MPNDRIPATTEALEAAADSGELTTVYWPGNARRPATGRIVRPRHAGDPYWRLYVPGPFPSAYFVLDTRVTDGESTFTLGAA